MYESCAELAAQIGPQLATLLHAHAGEIESEVHPALARWAVKHVLRAVEPHLPSLADHVIGYLCDKLKDVTMGEIVRFIDHLAVTSDFRPLPNYVAEPETDQS